MRGYPDVVVGSVAENLLREKDMVGLNRVRKNNWGQPLLSKLVGHYTKKPSKKCDILVVVFFAPNELGR